MRLVCPNCKAEYNVADDAFSDGARDVQCSNCQHTWFQTPASRMISREVSRVLSTPLPSVVKTQSRDVSAYDSPQAGNSRAEGPLHKPVGDGPRHRPVDPNVANILREEAELTRGVADYSADAPAPASSREVTAEEIEETRQRIARMTAEEGGTPTGMSPAAAAAAHAAAHADPHSIPELTEINAALRARQEAQDGSGLTELEMKEARDRRGFRRGFFTVLLLVALIISPYIFADEVVEAMPELSGYMATYVLVIDQMRDLLRAAVDAIAGLFA